jgi:hypothetical protein
MSSALVEVNDKMPREAKKQSEGSLDRIFKFYHVEKKRIKLTPQEERMREQIEHAWLMLTRLKPQKHVVDELMGKFNISQNTAFTMVRQAMIIFGDPRMQVKEAKRAIAEQQFLMSAAKILDMADELLKPNTDDDGKVDETPKTDKMDQYAKLMKLHLEYMKEYSEINGLKNPEVSEDGLAEVMKKLRPTQIILNFSKEAVEREAEKLHEELTRDVEFEDVT